MSILEKSLTLKELIKKAKIKELSSIEAYRPYKKQSITCIKNVVEKLNKESSKGIIVLAIDGLSYNVLTSIITSYSQLIPLTTTFPSNSICAWISANTGLSVEQHGYIGVCYKSDNPNYLFHAERDQYRDFSGEKELNNRIDTSKFPSFLKGTKSLNLVNLGTHVYIRGYSFNEIVTGNAVIYIDDPIAMRERTKHPQDMIDWAISSINKRLKEKTTFKKRIVWNLTSFDAYVHANGYSKDLVQAIKKLNKNILSWKKLGYRVILHSDHGMVPCLVTRKDLKEWAEINSKQFCSIPSGGAGRVLWCYPKKGMEEIVYEKLNTLLGKNALVLKKEDFFKLKLLPQNDDTNYKIGDIICIGISTKFPSPCFGAIYEHGGFSFDEMIIPLFIW